MFLLTIMCVMWKVSLCDEHTENYHRTPSALLMSAFKGLSACFCNPFQAPAFSWNTPFIYSSLYFLATYYNATDNLEFKLSKEVHLDKQLDKPCPSYDFGKPSAPSWIHLLSFLSKRFAHDKIAKQGKQTRTWRQHHADSLPPTHPSGVPNCCGRSMLTACPPLAISSFQAVFKPQVISSLIDI